MAIICTVLAPSFTLQTPCMLSELLRGRFGGVALVQLPFSLQATCCEFTANAASFILLILRNVCAGPAEHADLVTVSGIAPVLVESLNDVQVLKHSVASCLQYAYAVNETKAWMIQTDHWGLIQGCMTLVHGFKHIWDILGMYYHANNNHFDCSSLMSFI